MLDLPVPENYIFASAMVVYFVAAIVALVQLLKSEDYRNVLLPIVCLAVVLEAVVLIFRAVEINAVPLTGLFESMVVLTIVFGLLYLLLSIVIRQVWFASAMVWGIFAIVLIAGIVAKPASEPHSIAATPWALAHGIMMILAGASIMFATTSAVLYLLATHKLKQKRVMQVLGKVPNIEKLEKMTMSGLKAGFIFLTIGLASGAGLIYLLKTPFTAWLQDAKVICILATWLLLVAVLALSRLLALRGRTKAYMTIAAFALVVFAILGVAAIGKTQHDFSRRVAPTVSETVII